MRRMISKSKQDWIKEVSEKVVEGERNTTEVGNNLYVDGDLECAGTLKGISSIELPGTLESQIDTRDASDEEEAFIENIKYYQFVEIPSTGLQYRINLFSETSTDILVHFGETIFEADGSVNAVEQYQITYTKSTNKISVDYTSL